VNYLEPISHSVFRDMFLNSSMLISPCSADIIIALCAFTILKVVHLAFLGSWSSEVFAAITEPVGTVTGIIIAQKIYLEGGINFRMKNQSKIVVLNRIARMRRIVRADTQFSLLSLLSVKFNGVIINFLCIFNIMENIKGEIGC
jgi:hypothetical protein